MSLIQTAVLSSFDEKYISLNADYQVTIVSLCLAAIVFMVIIKKLWTNMQMREIDIHDYARQLLELLK